VTDPSPGPPGGPPPPPGTDLFSALAARQDASVEKLTHAVAKVLAEAARADTVTRAAQVDSIEAAMSRIVQQTAAASTRRELDARRSDAESIRSELTKLLGTVQRDVVERLGTASAADAEALRSSLSSGFSRVGDRVTEALRSEVMRLETALAPHGEVADKVVSALRDELLAALREAAAESTDALDSGFAAMRSTLAEVAHDGRSAAEGVVPLRTDLLAMTEAMGTELAALRTAVETAAKRDAGQDEERAERLRTELIVTLGALQESLRSPVETLAASLGESVQSLVDATRAEAAARGEAFEAMQRQVDELAVSTKAIAGAQDELRRLVAQLWGEST
jgi:hypothetical protein